MNGNGDRAFGQRLGAIRSMNNGDFSMGKEIAVTSGGTEQGFGDSNNQGR